MLLALASYSACSRSSSDKRMVKFFLGSINCPLRPISNPFFRFFFLYPSLEVPVRYPVSKTCVERICQIRKTPCVLQNLVRGSKIPLRPSQYMPLTGQVSVIHCVLPAFACLTRFTLYTIPLYLYSRQHIRLSLCMTSSKYTTDYFITCTIGDNNDLYAIDYTLF